MIESIKQPYIRRPLAILALAVSIPVILLVSIFEALQHAVVGILQICADVKEIW